MTNPNRTHITVVVDRSGSMNFIRTDAQGAINHFLTEQKAQPGECDLLLTDFDTQEPYRIVHRGTLASASDYTLEPRGGTPLLDAVGRAIVGTGDALSVIPEDERPGKVIFVVQTDGQENASREYTWAKVSAMVKEQTDTYGWEFIFLGMGLGTDQQGHDMGISNVIRTDVGNAATYDSTHAVLAASASSYRSGQAKSMGGLRGMHVNSVGQAFNADGDEVDPATGKVKDPAETS